MSLEGTTDKTETVDSLLAKIKAASIIRATTNTQEAFARLRKQATTEGVLDNSKFETLCKEEEAAFRVAWGQQQKDMESLLNRVQNIAAQRDAEICITLFEENSRNVAMNQQKLQEIEEAIAAASKSTNPKDQPDFCVQLLELKQSYERKISRAQVAITEAVAKLKSLISGESIEKEDSDFEHEEGKDDEEVADGADLQGVDLLWYRARNKAKLLKVTATEQVADRSSSPLPPLHPPRPRSVPKGK